MDPTCTPWKAVDLSGSPGVLSTIGMLAEEERKLLYWLGADYYAGDGEIVDAGAFLGCSAHCLAAGVAHNRTASIRKPCIHSYDLFRAEDAYVAEAITRDVRPLKMGERYRDIFEAQNRDFLDYIKIYEGDLCGFAWSGAPIDVLFIDVSKTEALNSHLLRQFFPALTPGRSLVVQQDFYHIWHPPIHVTMEYLRDYFEILSHWVPDQSRVYRLKAPIPAPMIEKAADYGFSYEERAALLDRSAAASPSPTREMLHAIRLVEAFNTGDRATFRRAFDDFVARYPDYPKSYALWAQQAGQVVDAAGTRGLL